MLFQGSRSSFLSDLRCFEICLEKMPDTPFTEFLTEAQHCSDLSEKNRDKDFNLEGEGKVCF